MKRVFVGLALCVAASVAFGQGAAAPAKASATPASAASVLAGAQTRAAASGKNVLVLFHASWCGWCKKTEAFMNLPQFKPLFDKSYEVVWLTVLESPDKKNLENMGSDTVLEHLGGANQGIPFFGVLDAKGNTLMNSRAPTAADPKGSNIGHPAAPEEIAYYMQVLRKTSKMTATELGSIESWLKAQRLG